MGAHPTTGSVGAQHEHRLGGGCFTSLAAFDAHRAGSYRTGRRCMAPAGAGLTPATTTGRCENSGAMHDDGSPRTLIPVGVKRDRDGVAGHRDPVKSSVVV